MATNKDKARKKAEARVIQGMETRKFECIPKEKLIVMMDDGINHQDNIKDMQDEILDNGLLSPISVVGPYPDGTYYVVDGARRVNSLDFVGNHKIPCYVVGDKNLTKKEVAVLALCANKIKRNNDMTLKVRYTQFIYQEYADGVIDRHTVTDTVRKVLNVSPRQARKYINIVENGSENVQNELANGNISINEANAIVNNNVEEDRQDAWLHQVKNLGYGQHNEMLERIKVPGGAKAVRAGVIASMSGENPKEAMKAIKMETVNKQIDKNINNLSELLMIDKRNLRKGEHISELIEVIDKLLQKLS